ncbi:MAG TPA: pilus assembly protein N-terminal domain-containing protein [Vicinamibacterales bacterium]|nr:pilus assembly protein N-terminal domain-containing protein [Vicinamibacterales bacterium]
MTRRLASALAGFIIVILVAGPQAARMDPADEQAPAFGSTAAINPAAAAAPLTVQLLVGRSTIVDIGATISRVSLTVPDVADAMVTAPTQLLVHGKQPGTISMFVWDRTGGIKTFEVVVRRDLSALAEQVRNLFPGEQITVAGNGKDVVLSGTVSSKYVIDKAAEVAGGYVEKKDDVVNLLKQAEGVASNQVLLRVRFAEVSRNALQELGASFFTDDRNSRWTARTTTQQFAAPYFDQNHPSAWLGENGIFSDFLNLFLFDRKNSIGAAIKALQARGVFQSLAEPNLIALNGKEASFLAGGEFPYPVPQGQFGTFTIHFKEYGVRLNFTPTVLGGDLINLKIRPEVSSLDFNNAIVLEGFRIPALTARRAETEVELQDGQTFAIAGLLNNTALSSMRKVPGIGDIPVLGHLFRSRAYQKDQTELVVMVTPQIVRRGSTGASEGLPSLVEPYMPANDKPIPSPAPYVGSPVYPPRAGGSPVPAPAPESSPTLPAPAAPPAQAAPTAAAPQPRTLVPDPVPSTPIHAAAPLPVAAPAPPVDRKALEAEKKAAEAAEKKRAAEEKKQADQARAAAKKEEEARRKAQKAEQARAKKQAEADRAAAERAGREARLKAEEEQKRQKALAEAEARLKEAQSAYQAELAKTKGGGRP